MHTAFRKMFPITREAVARLIDPAALRWIGFSHFESDEFGRSTSGSRVAPRAQAVCSFVGKVVMLDAFADREVRALADRDVLDTGHHRLEFLATPHVPHCCSSMAPNEPSSAADVIPPLDGCIRSREAESEADLTCQP